MTTKTATHTPGPWTADRLEGHVFTIATYKGENPDHSLSGRLIANCMGHSSNFELGLRDEQIANARLIAAAPSLLAAALTACKYGPSMDQCDFVKLLAAIAETKPYSSGARAAIAVAQETTT